VEKNIVQPELTLAVQQVNTVTIKWNGEESFGRVGIVDVALAVKMGGYSSFLNALRGIVLWSCSSRESESTSP